MERIKGAWRIEPTPEDDYLLYADRLGAFAWLALLTVAVVAYLLVTNF